MRNAFRYAFVAALLYVGAMWAIFAGISGALSLLLFIPAFILMGAAVNEGHKWYDDT